MNQMPQISPLISLLLIAATGCAAGGTVQESAMTRSQATVRADQLVRETAKSIDAAPILELDETSAVPTPCLFSEDGVPERYSISRKYWLRNMPPRQHMDVSRQVRAYWQSRGHTITATGDDSAGNPNLAGESHPDGFILALAWAEGDNLYLAATSPCLAIPQPPSP
jgi:hypothetical protein